MERFEFILPNEKTKLYHRFAVFLFVISVAGIILIAAYSKPLALPGDNNLIWAAGFALLVFPLYLAIFKNPTRYLKVFTQAFLLLATCWTFLGYWWAALISMLLLALYLIAMRPLKLLVQPESIIYPSFPKRIIQWKELNNLVLKDGLLTIDFKNDRIIQQSPEFKMNTIKEQEFNEFCRQQINRQ